MAIEVYLNFNGNCHDAVNFYTKVFGTDQAQIMNYGDVPPDPDNPISEDTKKLVMHTFLNINGNRVLFSDVPPGTPFITGNNISLVINSTNLDEMKSWFNQLKIDGTVQMELQETFWSKCYGFLVDKFGIGWQFIYNGSE